MKCNKTIYGQNRQLRRKASGFRCLCLCVWTAWLLAVASAIRGRHKTRLHRMEFCVKRSFQQTTQKYHELISHFLMFNGIVGTRSPKDTHGHHVVVCRCRCCSASQAVTLLDACTFAAHHVCHVALCRTECWSYRRAYRACKRIH